jgi:GNAT superfamily N-acetyltransferase
MNSTAMNSTAMNSTAMNSTTMNSTTMNSIQMTSTRGSRAETEAAVGLLRVRRAGPGDREALARMFARCTGRTRFDRFHGYVKAIPERYLTDALSGSPFHYALVALAAGATADGADWDGADPHGADWDGTRDAGLVAGTVGDVIVALASCRATAEGMAELGILVEDRWQRHGTGDLLLRELVGHADRAGFRVLKAQILSEQAWIITLLERYGACHVVRGGYGILDATLRLGSPPLSGPMLARAPSALRLVVPRHIGLKRTEKGAPSALRRVLESRLDG